MRDLTRAQAVESVIGQIICARAPKPNKEGKLRFQITITENEYADLHGVDARAAFLARALLRHMSYAEILSAYDALLGGPRLSDKWRDGVPHPGQVRLCAQEYPEDRWGKGVPGHPDNDMGM